MRVSLILFSILLLTLGDGCTPEATHVQGKVMMNGKPAEAGSVTFRSAEKNKPAFTIHCNIENGHYGSQSCERPLPFGKYEVRVAVTKKTGRQIPLPDSPNRQMQDEIIVISAVAYNGPKSPLKYEHTNKESVGTFDLEVPAGN